MDTAELSGSLVPTAAQSAWLPGLLGCAHRAGLLAGRKAHYWSWGRAEPGWGCWQGAGLGKWAASGRGCEVTPFRRPRGWKGSRALRLSSAHRVAPAQMGDESAGDIGALQYSAPSPPPELLPLLQSPQRMFPSGPAPEILLACCPSAPQRAHPGSPPLGRPP